MVKQKTCVFISGQGSNLKNLISHSRNSNFPIKISLVITKYQFDFIGKREGYVRQNQP